MASHLFEQIRGDVERELAYGIRLAGDSVITVGFLDGKIALQLEAPIEGGGRTMLTASLTNDMARLVGEIMESFADRGEVASSASEEGIRVLN